MAVNFTGSLAISGSLTATSTITAQTLVVQTITSSISSITGSTNFGSIADNTHTFTGSMSVSGSGTFTGALSGTSATFSGDLTIDTNTLYVDSTNNRVGICTTPSYKLHIIESTTNGRAVQGVATATSGTNYGAVLVAEGIGATKNIGLYASAEGATTNVAAVFDNGNVGIGTTSPGAKLEIFGTGNTLRLDSAANGAKTILLRNVGTETAEIKTDGNLDFNIEDANRTMRFLTSNTERMRITSGGNVGIGTNSPSYKLTVSQATNGFYPLRLIGGDSLQSEMGFYLGNGGGSLGLNTSGDLSIFTNGADRMRITSSGNVGIGTSSPPKLLSVASGTGNLVASTTTIAITTAGQYGSAGTPKNLDLSFLGFDNNEMARIRSWDESYSTGYGNLTFWTNNASTLSERMRITSDGKLYFNQGANSGYRVIIGATNGTRSVIITDPDAEGFAGGTTAMYIAKQTSTNRSINAAGTINASGADYAEYMRKSNADLIFVKGDVIGVDKNGLLTDDFVASISFVVKSTDPSYVGGDNWFNDETAPEKTEEQTEEEFNEIFSKWDAKYQEARKWIDRIAFSGQVPCNVYDAKVGDYIIPIELDGKISGQAVSNPTFEQYQLSVGKVWKIMEDGRAWIAVKIG